MMCEYEYLAAAARFHNASPGDLRFCMTDSSGSDFHAGGPESEEACHL